MFKPGTTYLLHMPTGWIVMGTAVDERNGYVTFRDCAYIERIGDGHSAVGSLPVATTADQFRAAATRYYKVAQPMSVRADSITFFLPCKMSLAEVA
jgi:hypothetical protein